MPRALMTSNRALVAVSAFGWLTFIGACVAEIRMLRSDSKEARRG